MQIWLGDPWALFSRKAGVIYASCILAVLGAHAYTNRIAPVAGTVSLLIMGLVTAAFLLLAGTSGETWFDPSNALALVLVALAFLLDGFFIAGASTFGPVRTLDVDVELGASDRGDAYFWDGQWFRTKLPDSMSWEEYRTFESWSENLDLVNDLSTRPGQIQISMWDRQVWRLTMKNWNPPTTIGRSPQPKPRCFLELLCGLLLFLAAFRIWREGLKRGISYRKHHPLLGCESIPM